MTKYKSQNFSNTFKNARKGFRLSLKSERNIRVHIFISMLVIATALFFNFSINKFCILLLTISSVISMEMINSAVEFTLDSIYHNKYSRMVGMAKDIAAGAVMFTSITAVMIGALLFVPPFVALFKSFIQH